MKITQVNHIKSPIMQVSRKVSFGESKFSEDKFDAKTQFQKAIEDLIL